MKRLVPDQFWAKVDKCGPDECWPWLASIDTRPYGQFMGRLSRRVAYELTNGPIPSGLIVCHSCDNPSCCNPNHLWLGTYADNSQDAVKKGRIATGSRHGSQTHPESQLRGTEVAGAKLNDDKVRAIRLAASCGERPIVIARKYGISYRNLRYIILGRTWKHVA